jgi:hypothetical protein
MFREIGFGSLGDVAAFECEVLQFRVARSLRDTDLFRYGEQQGCEKETSQMPDLLHLNLKPLLTKIAGVGAKGHSRYRKRH